MSLKARKHFFKILGQQYSLYGYPSILGWIEGLLTLYPEREWTQIETSQELNKIFPEKNNPTSVSTVNRAMKTLEIYGVVIKQGTRKLGYTYKIGSRASYLVKMFEVFLYSTQSYIVDLETLQKEFSLSIENKNHDEILIDAVNFHLKGSKILELELEKLISSIRSKEG